ncbi:30S ribosomal protein S3 [Aquicella siphonis]|uniref:Small ribosomal subunit protein uS3 n=1 Tax=Aquicella siphonis TaxID=254247 RepID=A0A5E4PEX4_9COXI|nr:30S ribosomal protein S3 [Aquicella siphonis]VVC75165.1 30S ribosomal protein S3 [Aquicella siphonis]
MGQKVNPVGIRLGIVKDWASRWYSSAKEFSDTLCADLKVRDYLRKKLAQAGISRIQIDRPARNARVTVYTARPGVIIGKSGKEVEALRDEVSKIVNVPVHVSIEEVRKPELDARLVAESVAQQLERRIMFRRAMKRAVTTALRSGALGIKISVSGRLGGSEIARTEWYREGRVPLQTFRADIDYALAEAYTTYGVIGVKVWIFKGEIIGDKSTQTESTEKTAKQEK